MAVKAPEIHPSALSDLKSAISWYLERSARIEVPTEAEATAEANELHADLDPD